MHIFIFNRGLRLTDNTTLIHQLKEVKEGVVPIFIFTPEQIEPKKNDYFSNNSVQFMIESLHELSDEIKKKGGKFYFFKGDNVKVLKAIHKKETIESVAMNFDYTCYSRKRSEDIQKFCKKNEIVFLEKEDYALHSIVEGESNKKDSSPYLVFTPFKNNCLSNLKVREPDGFKSFKFNKIENNKFMIDEKDIDDFYEDNPNINVHGGRKNGLKILKNIGDFKNYSKDRDTLSYKTTFLGAHNHYCTVSIREVYWAMEKKLGKHSGLISEIYWREYYMMITHNFPHILKGQISGKNQSYKKEYDNIKWSTNKKWFNNWKNAETGFPIIDASIRQLNISAFMHNRPRMINASFVTKDMHIDWRDGEKYFATKLVDYDPMSNSGGWMWSTGNGTDAQPWFRIFNPWTQQEKFDKDCEYIKKWIPELEKVPAKDLHNWFKPEVHEKWLKAGIKYYKPILDHDTERKETLKLYKEGLK